MISFLHRIAFGSLLAFAATIEAQSYGTTTRYWDCCKPTCGWSANVRGVSSPVTVCDIDDQPMSTAESDDIATGQSGCAGGEAYMCSDQTPWAVSDTLAYGFAATSESTNCCQCFQLTFTSGPIQGKQMIVQATNTGGDCVAGQFDIAMPGGGFGIFDGCTTEWGNSSAWGNQYGGANTNQCDELPSKLQAGCNFRWDWFQGADNPTVDYTEITCPAALTVKSGCALTGNTPISPSTSSAYAAASSSSGSFPSYAAPSSFTTTYTSPPSSTSEVSCEL